MRSIVLAAALLSCSAAVARDVQVERKVAFDIVGVDEARGIGTFQVRSPNSSSACRGNILRLPLNEKSGLLLYSLLLNAHMGERLVSVWFDLDNDCRITQGQIEE